MTASDLAPDVGLDIAAAEAAYHRARQREVWRRRLLPAVGIGDGRVSAAFAGRTIHVVNVGSNNITLKHENASSTAVNRMNLPGAADAVLTAFSSAWLRYDQTLSRWLCVAKAV